MHRRMYLVMEMGLGRDHDRAMEELTDGRAVDPSSYGASRCRGGEKLALGIGRLVK